LRRLQNGENPHLGTDEIASKDRDWFGTDLPLDGLRKTHAELHQEINALFAKMPRRERRKHRSELDLQKRSSHEKWRALINRGSQGAHVAYPFNLVEQSTIVGWFLGEITDAELRLKTLQLLSDPYVMFKYLLENTRIRQTLYDALRKQGRELADQIALSEQKIIMSLNPVVNSPLDHLVRAKFREACLQPETLRRIISSFEFPLHDTTDAKLADIVQSCPSLSTFVAVGKGIVLSRVYSYLDRIGAGKMAVKVTKPSIFGDIMHCLYAPYFDVFRCDAPFGAILKTHKPVRHRIADRISDLRRMLGREAATA
jgi:hypothetical protein